MPERVARFVCRVHLYSPHPAGVGRQPYKPPSVLRLLPTSFQARASLVEALLRSASTNDRCGFRVDRLPPPSPLSLPPDTAPASRCRAAIIAPTTANSLQRLLQRFIPTPFLRRGVRRVSISFAPKPPLAIPARKDVGIFTPSSGRRTAAVRHHPPAHKRTDERTMFSQWHSHLPPIRAKRIIRSGRIGTLLSSATPTSTTLQSVHEPLRGRAVCRVRRVFCGYSDTPLRGVAALSEVNATEYTPEQVRPARCPFVGLLPLRRRVLRYGHCNADTRPAHGIFHLSSATQAPTPGPAGWCDAALSPLRQSANHFVHSESPTD